MIPRILTPSASTRLGLTRAAVRHAALRNGWRPLGRGVLLTSADPPTRSDWVLAGLAIAGPRSAVSGWDVVRRSGLGGPDPPSERVLVLTPVGHNRVFGSVRIRVTSRDYRSRTTSVNDDALPLVAMAATARAVADTALMYGTFAPVRAMVTTAIQRQVCTIDELVEELQFSPRKGSGWLRRALNDVVQGARSIAEADAADALRRRAAPPFEMNAPIRDRAGRVVAVADFLWRPLRAIVEIDSREFHFGEAQWKGTMRRHNELLALGYTVAHYPPSDIRLRPAAWADEVTTWLAARAAELRLSPVT